MANALAFSRPANAPPGESAPKYKFPVKIKHYNLKYKPKTNKVQRTNS